MFNLDLPVPGLHQPWNVDNDPNDADNDVDQNLHSRSYNLHIWSFSVYIERWKDVSAINQQDKN